MAERRASVSPFDLLFTKSRPREKKHDPYVEANGYEQLRPDYTPGISQVNWLMVGLVVLLLALGILGAIGFARTFSSKVVETIPHDDLRRSMQLLFEGFLVVDGGFNDPSRFNVNNAPPGYGLGLTIQEINEIGFYTNLSTALAHGPFEQHPDSEYPQFFHTEHSNKPGVFQSVGESESSFLQMAFEGGLFNDTLFPWFPEPLLAPRLYHAYPRVSAYLGFDRMNVLATGAINWGPNIGDNLNNTGALVAQVASIAQYKMNRDASGNILIPTIDWIHFTIRYED